MSVPIPFTFNLVISGTNISSYSEVNTFDLANKYENSFAINSGDSAVTLDFSNIENPRVLIFYGDGNFSIKFTDTDTNTFILNNFGEIPTVIPINSIFLTTYTSIEILTSEADDVEIQVRAYGEESA
jgi:hypothetical protein